MSEDCRIVVGDALETLRALPDQSARCCVTSPPYWGLRDYGHAGQLGLESTPEQYVSNMVALFGEVRRVLADDGTLWLNLGDCYAGSGKGAWGSDESREANRARVKETYIPTRAESPLAGFVPVGLKSKDLVGIPWMVAFALRADGWYLRSDIIWSKPNPMPESVTDRPTKAHEYMFLLSKAARYYYDAAAIAEPAINAGRLVVYDGTQKNCETDGDPRFATRITSDRMVADTRNRRTVWTVATQPFKEAHFATFPPALVEPCVRAGSAPGDVVLDPFSGAGTTGLVARRLGRRFLGIELNPAYAKMARRRIYRDAPLFEQESA